MQRGCGVMREAASSRSRKKAAGQATDRDLLTFAIDANTDGQDFFIRKAIGWALRELAKRDPALVRSFVADRRAALSGLSQREALMNIGPQSTSGPVNEVP